MKRPFLGVSVFTILLLLLFVYVGEVLTRISGEATRGPGYGMPGAGAAITPEAGKALFWGRGACYTCHSIGKEGSAIRGPNLGDTGPLNLPIGARAVERAKEQARQTGKPYTPTDYLLESLIEPSAYLVEGFSKIMPVIYRPPIALKPDEIRAVITYLQSLGGTVDVASIDKSPFFAQLQAQAAAEKAEASVAQALTLFIPGDPERGKELFFNPKSPAGCAKCHTVGDEGGRVGPELTKIAAAQPLEYIVESTLEPSKVIVTGFEPVLLKTRDGRFITGIIKKEGANAIEIADSQGQIQRVSKAEVAERVPQKTSLMPGNFGEILTVKEFSDLLAFLETLK